MKTLVSVAAGLMTATTAMTDIVAAIVVGDDMARAAEHESVF